MPLKDVEPGTKTVEEKIDEILEDTSTTLEDKLDAIKLIIDDILIDTSTTLENKLDAIKPIIDAILEDTSTTLEDKINALSTLLTTAEAEIDAIEAKLDNATYGLDALRILLDALEIKLDNATYGLSALQKLIWSIECKLDNVNWGLYAISAAIAAVETKLDSDVYGLSALKTLIDAIEGKLDVPANFMADTSALALEATLGTHDTDIKTLIAALNNISDAEVWAYVTRTLTAHAFPFTNPAAALDVSNIRTSAYPLLTDGTYGLSALNTDIDKLLTGTIQGTGTVLPANKSLYDVLWVDRSLDESGSFLWDTSAYTTVEQDISALFTTNLTGTKRRKYMVYLDMTAPAGDAAAWTECTVKVKVKIDGTNYRTIDRCVKAKTDLAATAEPGIPIEIPFVAQDCQITMQFDVALASDQTIYYHKVEEKMEY